MLLIERTVDSRAHFVALCEALSVLVLRPASLLALGELIVEELVRGLVVKRWSRLTVVPLGEFEHEVLHRVGVCF